MASEHEPSGEPLRKAVRWISERRAEDPEAKWSTLIDEASLRFDLSPADQQFLWTHLARAGVPAPEEPDATR